MGYQVYSEKTTYSEEFLIFVTLNEYLLFFSQINYRSLRCCRVWSTNRLKKRDGKQEEIPLRGSLLLTVDYTNGTSFIFLLSLLYPWLRKRLRNFAHKCGNQVQHLISTLVLKQLRTCATQISSEDCNLLVSQIR